MPNNKRTNNNQKRRTKNRRGKRSKEVKYTLPTSRLIVPDEMITNMRWTDQTHYVFNNAGLNYATIRYRPTGVYDIDPTLGTTAVPGFGELSGLYGKYRTMRSGITVDFANLEKFPVRVFVWPSNFDLGNNYPNLVAAMDAPFARSRMISAETGNDRTIITIKPLTSKQVIGNQTAYTDDDYSANTNTTPVNNWYWNVGIWSPANLLTSGVQVLVTIKLAVQFSERLMLVN